MKLRVLYFASVRERLRRSQDEVEVGAGATVATLWMALAERHPALREVGDSLRFAVNQEYVERQHRLADGDEVAVIPPVSGGA